MFPRLIRLSLLIKLLLKVLFLISSIMKHKLFNFIKLEVSILKKSKLFFPVIVLIVCLILLILHLLTPSNIYTQAAVDPLTAAAIVSAIGGVASSLFGHSQNKQMNDKNIQMQRETNWMNYLMNRENNVSNQMHAIEMFNLENEYNDPKNQMARLKAAGINPFVAAGGSNIGQVEGRADTIPAQQPLPMMAPQYKFDQGIDFATPMAQLASAIGSIAQAKKAGAETEKIERTLEWEIESMQLQNLNERAKLRVNNIQATISEMYGLVRTKQDIEKADKEIGNLVKRGLLYDEEIDIAKVDYLLKDVEHGINHKQYKRYDEQLNALIEQIKDMNALIRTQRETEHARAVNEYSQAGEHNARTESIRKQTEFDESIRDYLRTVMRNDAKMSDNEMVDYYSTRPELLHIIYEEAERAGYITKEQAAKARKAQAEGDYAEVRQLLGTIGDAVGIGTSVYGAKTGRIGATNKSYDYYEIDSEGNTKRGYRRYGR